MSKTVKKENVNDGIGKSIEDVLEEYKESIRAKASRYFILGAEKEDLVQEGMIGLVKAYNSFDKERGASFATFAELCITREMLSAIKIAARKKNAPLNEAVSLDKPIDDDENTESLAEILASDSSSDPEAIAIYRELISLIAENSENIFSKSEAEIVKLVLSGLDSKELGKKLGKTPKQIDNAMQRIKGKLKAFLE